MDVPFEAIVKSKQELYHEGNKLLGPLALCDYPQLVNGTVLRAQLSQEEAKA